MKKVVLKAKDMLSDYEKAKSQGAEVTYALKEALETINDLVYTLDQEEMYTKRLERIILRHAIDQLEERADENDRDDRTTQRQPKP